MGEGLATIWGAGVPPAPAWDRHWSWGTIEVYETSQWRRRGHQLGPCAPLVACAVTDGHGRAVPPTSACVPHLYPVLQLSIPHPPLPRDNSARYITVRTAYTARCIQQYTGSWRLPPGGRDPCHPRSRVNTAAHLTSSSHTEAPQPPYATRGTRPLQPWRSCGPSVFGPLQLFSRGCANVLVNGRVFNPEIPGLSIPVQPQARDFWTEKGLYIVA